MRARAPSAIFLAAPHPAPVCNRVAFDPIVAWHGEALIGVSESRVSALRPVQSRAATQTELGVRALGYIALNFDFVLINIIYLLSLADTPPPAPSGRAPAIQQ